MIMRDASRGKWSSSDRLFTRIWPVPILRRTRATAVLRLPVATNVWGSGKIEDLRLLCGVRMLGPGVDLELAEHLPAERVLREHAAHGALEHALGVRTREHLVGGGLLH